MPKSSAKERSGRRHPAGAGVAAILHDIACPLCREKYGIPIAECQEAEGKILAAEFLSGLDLPAGFVQRAVYLVGRHHTLTDISGLDYQILIKADCLVNAGDAHLPPADIRAFMELHFKTQTGLSLLKSMYKITQPECK